MTSDRSGTTDGRDRPCSVYTHENVTVCKHCKISDLKDDFGGAVHLTNDQILFDDKEQKELSNDLILSDERECVVQCLMICLVDGIGYGTAR